jgi:predicted DNA-binding transcriptional regulator AlpA
VLTTLQPNLPRLARVKDILAWLRISRSTFYLWRAQGKIPAGRRIGSGVQVYDLDEVAAALGLEVRS